MVTRKAIYTWKLSWILLLNILHSTVEAGPAKRSGRMAREVYPEIEPENGDGNQVCIVGDVVYASDEPVPAEQPCLKCRCQPPGVQCETIKCVKKSGCKAIHRPNKCCPDYQCECHHEGKVYANGERLKTPPGGECKVCYCRGGEVQCAEVSCYIRTDCEGKTVPGQCCPKYDHCPPKEPLLGRPSVATKEITELANKLELATTSAENALKKQTTDQSVKQIEEPKITIHEIIPEIKEIPMTAPSSKLEETKDLLEGNNNDVTDPEPDSSEISEVFQQPPPVLRIGDKLLFLKQGELVPEKDASTPTSVITIIGAEGLQRGFEDSAELHEVSLKNYEDNTALFNNSNDLEPKTSESTHILSLVKKKSSVETTTVADDNSTKGVEEVTEPAKVLILQISNSEEADNKTSTEVKEGEENQNPRSLSEDSVEENTTLVSQPLKEVEEMTTFVSDTTETVTETTSSESSAESMEETTEDSGENTTPKNDHASIVSDENASVEPSANSETDDMLKDPNPTSFLPLEDVEMIDNKTSSEEKVTPVSKDVEMINVDNFTRVDTDVKNDKIELPTKSIGKRESSRQGDDIFRELEAELNADSTERVQTVEEEREEADKIFQELLEETSTPRTVKKGREESLQRVTDTIAKLTLRGRKNSYDTNILGLISNFFGSPSKLEG